jgi:hypothetical protein
VFFVCKNDAENFANSDLRWVGRLVGSSVGGLDWITLPNPNVLTPARSSVRLRCGSGEVRMPAPVGSGGFGQKLLPIFLIGWGLT